MRTKPINRYGGLSIWNNDGVVVIAKTKKRAVELLRCSMHYFNGYYSACANAAMEALLPQGEGVYREKVRWGDVYERVR